MSLSLDREMLSVLLALELLSHGTVQAWDPSGGHAGEPDDRIIAAILCYDEPPHLHYRRRYDSAHSDYGRRDVLDEAADELRKWVRRSQPAAQSRSLAELIVEDGEGWAPEVVAQRFGVAAAFVRRIRASHDREQENGRELKTPGGRAQWAQSLSQRGMTQVEIARRMGVSQPTVHRLLKARFVHGAA